MKKNDILEVLETMPEFVKLKAGLTKQLSENDFYVQECYPDRDCAERDEDGRIHTYRMGDKRAYEFAVDELLNGFHDDLRDEWVHEHEIRNDVTDFIVALAKQILK